MEEIEILKKLPNAVYVCDACLALSEYDDRHSDKLLSDMGKKIDDFSCLIDFAKNFERNMKKIMRDELVRINKRSVTAEDKNELPRSVVTRSTAKKRRMDDAIELEPMNLKTSEGTSTELRKGFKNKTTMLETERKKIQSYKPDPIVVIKPKEGIQVDNARAELIKKIDGKNLNVRRVMNGKDGSVVVTLKDKASIKLIEENVGKHLGGRFEVNVRDCMKPTIKIISMSDHFDEAELKKILVSQNEVFTSVKHFKLRKIYCNEKWQYDNYSAIVELDAETFFKVMDVGKLNCGWNRCRVLDGLQVIRCYKCCGFNHKIADCKAKEETCPICSGNHPVKECTSHKEKCANCEKLRIERKLIIDVDHSAWSSECPVYMRQREKRNKMVDFTT